MLPSHLLILTERTWLFSVYAFFGLFLLQFTMNTVINTNASYTSQGPFPTRGALVLGLAGAMGSQPVGTRQARVVHR